jgi:hypothetical protein
VLPLILVSSALFAQAQRAPKPPAPPPAVRCGWLDNPTPGNFFLRDRDGEWTLAEQGGYQARGIDLIPDLSGNEFVETNGPHGYACACLRVTVSAKMHRVEEIFRVTPRLLKVCLGDRDLAPMPR